ncbi:type I pantothenate kinase, partial [Varibaculum cambriense]
PAWFYRGHQDLPNLEKKLDQDDGRSGLYDHKSLAVSDFFDFSIYVDARTRDIERWFLERFLSLKESAFSDPNSYFQVYSGISDSVARQIALDIWNSINLPNLEQQIRPTRGRATLILRKDAQHRLENVYLRKI